MDKPADDAPRFAQGDLKYPAHFELEAQGWTYQNSNGTCKRCRERHEWWTKVEDGNLHWQLFNRRTTQLHKETCTGYVPPDSVQV
jgi:hypothetical protein